MAKKSYVFVCGCPRSGTSATRHLLANSRELIMGSERFAGRVSELGPELFDRDRYFRQEGDECGYDMYTAKFKHHDAGQYFRDAQSWFDDAIYIGDKIPFLYQHLNSLALSFPGAKVIVTARNIHEVAASYKRRATDAADTRWESGGVEEAIRDWNALFPAIAQAPDALSVYVVPYQDLFLMGQGFDRLLAFVGLKNTPELQRAFEAHVATARALSAERPLNLTPEETARIDALADFEGWRSFVSQ